MPRALEGTIARARLVISPAKLRHSRWLPLQNKIVIVKLSTFYQPLRTLMRTGT